MEETFSSRVITEKHLQHQHDLFYNYIDFKNTFDRVCQHAGLWQILRSFNIDEGLVQAIQALCENSSSAVHLNSQLGKFFKTTARVHHGCLLSPILFNLFLEIMQETLHGNYTSISIGGRPLCNLQFADSIDLMGSGNGEFQDLTKRLVD